MDSFLFVYFTSIKSKLSLLLITFFLCKTDCIYICSKKKKKMEEDEILDSQIVWMHLILKHNPSVFYVTLYQHVRKLVNLLEHFSLKKKINQLSPSRLPCDHRVILFSNRIVIQSKGFVGESTLLITNDYFKFYFMQFY